MKYLLIDGNNLAVRSAFANAELKSNDGTPTGAIYGTFNSLINLRKNFPDYQFLISWDSKSKRRVEESQQAQIAGLIPEIYKENRKKNEMPPPLKAFYDNANALKNGIGATGIPQIQVNGYEADDILGAYSQALKQNPDNEIVLVTSDKDYFQLLDQNVFIWDGMKSKMITLDVMKEETGLTPEEFIHSCSLMGDDGDNIFGVPGCGDKTATEKIKTHKTIERALESIKSSLVKLKEEFPDLNTLEDGQLKFDELKNAKTEKGKSKWPEITFDMPYTGIAWALEFKKTKEKIVKNDIQIVMFEKRIHLARSLKTIDRNMPEIYEINQGEMNLKLVNEFLNAFDIYSINPELLNANYVPPKEDSLFNEINKE